LRLHGSECADIFRLNNSIRRLFAMLRWLELPRPTFTVVENSRLNGHKYEGYGEISRRAGMPIISPTFTADSDVGVRLQAAEALTEELGAVR
jgi:hypothetical protein